MAEVIPFKSLGFVGELSRWF